MSQCPNCGNPWLESYEAAGKCDACGFQVPTHEKSAQEDQFVPDQQQAFYPSAETVGMTGTYTSAEPGPEV